MGQLPTPRSLLDVATGACMLGLCVLSNEASCHLGLYKLIRLSDSMSVRSNASTTSKAAFSAAPAPLVHVLSGITSNVR